MKLKLKNLLNPKCHCIALFQILALWKIQDFKVNLQKYAFGVYFNSQIFTNISIK
jgi:hypothetical protein